MKIRTFIVDAFTDKPFKGNPAGVCLLKKPIDEQTMQSIANEINLSETDFLTKIKNTEYSIRYFTPTVEVAFCGHATLASAKVLLHVLGKPKVEFNTHHGLKIEALGEGEKIKMKFPLYDTIEYNVKQELYDAFTISNPIATRFAKELQMLLVEVENNEALLALTPDFKKCIQTSDVIKEVVVTTKSRDNEYDFNSRCFCPWIGIDEDPVTGAAHSVLAKYWGDLLGKTEMQAYQSSKRGGHMQLKIINNTELEVVSNAVIIFEGTINI